MALGDLAARTVALAVAGAAVGGLLIGGLIGAAGNRQDADEDGTQQSSLRPSIPPFIVLSPTSTPRPDHPSPDLGNLVSVRDRGGEKVLRFDRVTVRGTEKTGYTIDNQTDRIRQRTLADDVEVIGAEKLTRQPVGRTVPLSTLLGYLERSGTSDPLLVWLSYRDDGKVVEVREQNLP